MIHYDANPYGYPNTPTVVLHRNNVNADITTAADLDDPALANFLRNNYNAAKSAMPAADASSGNVGLWNWVNFMLLSNYILGRVDIVYLQNESTYMGGGTVVLERSGGTSRVGSSSMNLSGYPMAPDVENILSQARIPAGETIGNPNRGGIVTHEATNTTSPSGTTGNTQVPGSRSSDGIGAVGVGSMGLGLIIVAAIVAVLLLRETR